jgi:hypothetical protein
VRPRWQWEALLPALLALAVADARMGMAGPPPPVVVRVDAESFEVSGEGNAVVGLRRAPVPYASATELSRAVRQPRALATSVRLVRVTPPQVIDYVWCVTEDGTLVVGQQVRTLDVASGHYVFTEGHINRAYPALEATVPWTWIVNIPLGREVGLTLDVQAMSKTWPVRAVSVAPRVER